MSRPGGKPGKERRLGDDEAELWEAATRTVDTVKAKPRAGSAKPSAGTPPRHAADITPKAATPPPKPAAERAAPPKKAPPLADFDRRKVRQIASGKVAIDATIDLHGLTQSEAHARLRAFLRDAHESGFRTVRVITGKGARSDTRDYMARALGQREQGVLRRAVPLWLAQPDLAALVVSFTTAAGHHGGEGALYVQLRKSRREESLR